MSRQSLELPDSASDLIDVVRDIIADAASLPRLMEAHYLVQEADMLEIAWRIASVPRVDRRKLRAFLMRFEASSQLRVREAGPGVIQLEYRKNGGRST